MEDERQRLLDAIAALEGQRAALGDAVVEVAVAPLKERLGALDAEPPEEQRKLVTVLFADLAGFTAMSETMDPEDVRELTAAYFERWSEAVAAHGGVVEKFIGDAVLAVFGLPVAAEDDPERAVRTALDMVATLARLNDEGLERRWGRRLEMRVGVNTGMALVTTLDERRGDFVVVGDVVNTASRLQSAAPLGGILVSHDTYRHVRGVFDVQPQEPLRVKGKAEPLQVYVVQQAKRRAFRTGVRGIDDVDTPFLGRARELEALRETLLAMATFGGFRVVTIVGDPGVGKSRLLFEFDNWVELLPERFSYFKARTSPASLNHPYSLLRDLVATRFQIQESDPPAVVRAKVEDGVAEAVGSSDDDAMARAHFLGQLVGFDFSASRHVAPALRDARQLRDRGVAALADVLCATAARTPAVVLLEDLHWADDSSLDALADLSGRLLEHSVSVVCTARPGLLERRPNWGEGLPDAERIDLSPLTEEATSAMVDAMLPGGVPDEVRRLVVEQAEGNPFYVEELVAMLVEDGVVVRSGDRWVLGTAGPPERRVPPTLTGVIQARVDGLPAPDRSVLQRASVVGRTFWDEAVAFVAGVDSHDAASERALGDLRARDMVFQSPQCAFEGTREFLFKHALLRDVTYEGVLRRDRRRYHRGTAGWLEVATERSQRVEEYAAVIAEHHERAGELEPAARWYARAATRAAATFANTEAGHFVDRALELGPADDLPWRFELLLVRERLHDLAGDRPDQAAALDELQALAEALDDDRSRAVAWLRRSNHEFIVGEYGAAVAAAATAVDLAVAAGDKGLEAEGELEQASVLWRRAEYDEANAHLHRSRELAESAGRTGTAALALRALGIVAHVRGEWDDARAHLEEALRLAREDGDARLEGQVVNSMGIVALDSGDFATARSLYQRSLAIKRRIGDRRGEASTLHNLGVLAAEVGDLGEGRRYLDQALEASRATVDAEGESVALLVLGATALAGGDHAGARALIERALPLLRQLDDQQGVSEALSFLAMVDHRQGDQEAAAARGRESADLAHRVGNPREEFQGLTVLGHALYAQGRLDEAAATYEEALAIRQRVEPEDAAVGLLAGLARTELARGRLDAAVARVREVLASGRLADRHSFDEPGLAGLVAHDVLLAAGDEEGAADVLERAGALLDERASRLEDEDRVRFLQEVPAHRRLVELLGRRAAG